MAAHSIAISDGTNTVLLNVSGANVTTDYKMGTPSDTDDLDDEPLITETLDVMLRATTGPLLQTAVKSVESLLVAAKRRQRNKFGPRVFLQLQVDGEASQWRAEVTDGHFEPDPDMLKTGWPNLRAEGALMVTHRVWEGPRTELQLASVTSTTPATGGKPITNGPNSWVAIVGSQVGGVLPAPVELQLTNTSGSDINFRNYYLANNAFSDPANFPFNVEGEARKATYGTITADATCSNGFYNAYGFTTTGEIQWDLSAAMMQDTQGREFQLLARFLSWSGTNVYVQPVLCASDGGTPLAWGDEQRLPSIFDTHLFNLGSLPLPNSSYYTSYAATVLKLKVRATGAATVNVDFIHLIALDAYQHIAQRANAIPSGGVVTFDNIEGVYHYAGNTFFSPRAGVLKVFPGVTQHIHILCDEGNAQNVSRAWTVRAYIRERRLTV